MGMLLRACVDGVVFYRSPLLDAAGVPHAFSTRLGGVSPAPFDSLNLGNPNGCPVQDDVRRIAENYRRLQDAVGCGERERCYAHQVHGTAVVRADAGRPFDTAVLADVLVTRDPSRVLSVRVADCVPVLLADDKGRAVAAVHSGWRGVVAGAVAAAVAATSAEAGVPPARLLAAVGPCIGPDAFEVGGDVLDAFVERFGPGPWARPAPHGKGYVDLRETVRLQLRQAGVAADRIDLGDRCTYRDAEEFFSHRRERGVTGRMAALIGPAAAE